MRVQTIWRTTTATPDSALKSVSKVWFNLKIYARSKNHALLFLNLGNNSHLNEITSFSRFIHADSFTHADLGTRDLGK